MDESGQSPKRQREDPEKEEVEEEDDSPPMAPEKPIIKTLGEARKATPASLFESAITIKGRIKAIVAHGISFKFCVPATKKKPEENYLVYDVFSLMPTFSFIVTMTMTIHVPTNAVISVHSVQYVKNKMANDEREMVMPDSLTVSRIAKMIGSKVHKSLHIRNRHDCYKHTGLSGPFFSQAVDNFFKLSSSLVRSCLFYPLHTVQLHWNEVVNLRLSTPDNEIWKLAFRNPHLPLGPVDPLRIYNLMNPPQTIKAPLLEIVDGAMVYQKILNQPWRLWFGANEIMPFMVTESIMVEDTRRKGQYVISHYVPYLALLRDWLNGEYTLKLSPNCPLWSHNGVGLLPMDSLYTKVHQEIRALKLVPRTMCPRDDVKGAFSSFMGTELGVPDKDVAFVAIVPYLDIWNLYELNTTLTLLRKHGNCVAILFHGNLSVQTDLMHEINVHMAYTSPLMRRDDCPPWIPANPKFDPDVSLLPRHEDFFNTLTLPISPDYLVPKGQACFIRRNHENDIKICHLYWHLYGKYMQTRQYFAIQTFVMKQSYSPAWRKILFDTDCPARPPHMGEKFIAVGEKVLDTRTNTLLAVTDMYGPDPTTTTPSLRAINERCACRYQGHDVWLQCHPYSPCDISHHSCCGSLGFLIPDKHCLNLRLHQDHLVDGTAITPFQYTIPQNFVSFIFFPTEPHPSPFLMQFLFSIMCRTRRSVIVYGLPRSIL